MMKKEYSRLSIYSLCLSIFFIIPLSGCSRKYDERYQQLLGEFKEKYDIRLPRKVKRIYIINDNYCPVCVTSFSNYVLKKIDKDDKEVLCFVNSEGHNVDMEQFRKIAGKNIYLSSKIKPYNEGNLIPPGLGVMFLNENKIDTIIYIDSEIIESQLGYIESIPH